MMPNSTELPIYRTSTHTIWRTMLARCLRTTAKDFARYGGRGITVCEQWLVFDNFLSDMGFRPEGMMLDRIDNDGPYSPDNCRWATPKQQARNRRNNVRVSYNGETLSVAEWAEKVGLERKTLEYRIRNGWTADMALTTAPIIKRKH